MARRRITVPFLLSSALSLLGNSVAGVVLPLVLLATTGDALAAGTLALICAVPQVAAGMLGGAALDRFNRRDVSIISDVMSAGAVALLPLIDLTVGLNFGWFVFCGVLGAIGDIPGMTARDALLPAVTERDGVSLQRFLGLSQSLDSLTTIIGPALAALAISLIGGVNAFWFTAAMSLAAALVTTTIPRPVGAVRGGAEGEPESAAGPAAESAADAAGAALGNGGPAPAGGLFAAARASLAEGVRVLFRSDAVLSASVLLTLGIVMVMGSYQGLVLPAYFTEIGRPELLGYLLSGMSAGMLAGSLGYASLAPRLAKRTWYLLSLVGRMAGVGLLGALASFPLMFVGALVLGISAGPASALLGFFVLDRIPEASRGSALGTQNSLMLVAAPAAMFASSILVSLAGIRASSLILVAAWLLITLAAMAAKSLRSLDGEPAAEPYA